MEVLASIISFLGATIRTSTPILFVALGILITQSSGILNMGGEGMMLIGAFSGVVGTYATGNVWIGTLIAILVTGFVGLIHAYICIEFQVNQVVLGVAFNILGSGITTTLSRSIFGTNSTPVKLDSFSNIAFGFSLPVYIGFILVGITSILLYKTKAGLKIRAAGEHPKAVDTVGLSVPKIRYLSSILGAMLIGFGGAFLSLGQLNFFTEDMVNGRGYIALAAVAFGKYTPFGTMLAVLLFGAGDSLQYRLQVANNIIPFQFAVMIPYVLTIIALAGFIRKAAKPAALGKPYFRKK